MAVLLSPDGHRSLQPGVLACHGLPSVKTAERATRLPRALSRGRTARRDPHRQRRALRLDRHPRPVRAQRLVDAARHRSSAHPLPRARRRTGRTSGCIASSSARRPGQRRTLPARRSSGSFDAFRHRYNDERPHEGIDDRVPARSGRPRAPVSRDASLHPDYPAHLEVRRVSTAGTFRLHSAQPFLSNALAMRTSVSRRSTTAFGTSSTTARCSARSMNGPRRSPASEMPAMRCK